MNHIRVIALVMAVAMTLTLFVFAVDGASFIENTAVTAAAEPGQPVQIETALPVTAAEKTETPAAANEPVQTVSIETIKAIETIAASDTADPQTEAAADVSAAVTKAVRDAVEKAEPEKPSAAAEMPVVNVIQAEKKDAVHASASADMGTYNWGVTAHALSDADRDLIERVVAAEAMGCVYDGLVGVAQVIRERAESWGMTPREVVTAEKQFASPYQGEVSEDVRRAVSDVFDRGVRVFAEHTTHFHSADVDPFWNDHKTFRGEIDTQLFWGVDEP